MKTELLHFSYLLIAFLVLFAVVEIIYQTTQIKAEYSRKLVHIFAGMLTLVFPILLKSHWSVLVLTGLFSFLLFTTKKLGWLPSIHAIYRASTGSYYYPISIYLSFLFYQYMDTSYFYYLMPVLILSLADAAAAIFGKRWPIGRYILYKDPKTMMGSSMFFTVTILISGVLFHLFLPHLALWIVSFYILSIAALTTFVEAASSRGLDNLFVPIAVMFILIMLNPVL